MTFYFLGTCSTSLSLFSDVAHEHSVKPFLFHWSYIEDKYSGISTQALLSVWSSLKGNRGIAHKLNGTNHYNYSDIIAQLLHSIFIFQLWCPGSVCHIFAHIRGQLSAYQNFIVAIPLSFFCSFVIMIEKFPLSPSSHKFPSQIF